ncbi:hypothetical protein [Ovoidimarina sediminis]|uniref:hypothetical protein n=1 Tax=Ovoidimarina sediminis TaxID=3079856 RepID=UPI00291153B7|nr:hypothetical protein [Rhodophyticola sp. MJ-SS7]MDU8944649.1 hypothetical protein [Rhodophyticola sp. MJ-SS7]
MKNLIYTTVATLALATAASADTQLDGAVERALEENGIYADVTALPTDVKSQIVLIEQGGDADGTRLKIEQLLREAGWTEMEMAEDQNIWYAYAIEIDAEPNSLREHVDLKLTEYGYDLEGVELTDDEVMQLFAIVQSSEEEPSRGAIEKILQ